MENTIIITKIADTYGFGIRKDNGDRVYIPSSIAMNFDLSLNSQYKARLHVNEHDRVGNVPWFAGFIFTNDVIDAADEDEPKQPTPKEETREQMIGYILELLSNEGAFSTSEMSKILRKRFSTADAYIARELFVKLFNEGRVVKADIHKSPDQKRASATIWAVAVEDIIGEGHDIDELQVAAQ